MTWHVAKAGAAVIAAVVLLAWAGASPAQAQYSYPGGYDPASGWTWDEDFRYNPVTNPFGYRTEEARPSYSYGNYPSAYERPGYYYSLPRSVYAPSQAGYSYGSLPSAGYYDDGPPGLRDTASIRVVVPADAKVWFDDSATKQGGRVRDFESPELSPGKTYTYAVKARWRENGKDVTQTRQIDVRADSTATVDFTRPDPRSRP